MKTITPSQLEWLHGKMTVEGYKALALEVLIDHVKANKGEQLSVYEDDIHDIVDGIVPVYHSDLLALIVDMPDLADVDYHDSGLVNDGSIYDVVGGNLFFLLEDYLRQELDEVVDEHGQSEDEDEV